ncbi:MAG TPA: zinc ribbon domain-containing protein [Thermoanaerobaculia bacterium]|jgi:putative FmdB family regulatory protein
MPIYEFYCESCHTLFNFFSARIDTGKRPACPRCGRARLPRRPSRFATLRHAGAEEGDPFSELDEGKLEGAMDALMNEAGGLENEEDPRVLARLMRRFTDVSGLEMGERMAELVARLEAGEDPESLEREMDDVAGEEDFDDFFKLKNALQERRRKPRVDDELYFL